MMMHRTLLLAVVLLTPALAHGQRELTKIPDPDPELERKSFIVADGFEVNLFAADPLLAKPIQMNFDAAGRLWIAASEVYPQIQPGQKATDKILVLEDRDGDGKADKTTIFAEGLLIPTGLEPGDGGVYVADSTDLVHFKDTDGDGKADQKRTVLSGFGTEDTHHILHTFRWGPDGRLYFNQSIYIHSHIETPHGVRRLGAGGIWRFQPHSLKLDVFARGFVNPWGHHFDRWGQSLATDGAYGEGINYVIPGAYFVAANGATRIMEGLNPGSPKHCGLEVVSGRHLPPDWQGNCITNDFRAHRVCRFVLSEDGAGYASQEKPELIKTTHAAFRPVDVKMGPDGAIYIADWYNPIIQHGEVDFRDPRRDHTHGRIWRVTARGRPLVPRPQLVKAATPELLDHLKAPEEWTRRQARRVLAERGRAILPHVQRWLTALDPAASEVENHLVEGLWLYQALDTVEPHLLGRLLGARRPQARAAAVRVLGDWHPEIPNTRDLLATAVADAHPQVRLEAVRTLGRIPEARSAELAVRVLEQHLDRFLEYGLWLTIRELAPQWLPALEQGELAFRNDVRALTYALQALASPEAVRPLVKLAQAGRIPPDSEESVLLLVTRLGGAAELEMILNLVLTPTPEKTARNVALLRALADASQQRKMRPRGDLQRVQALLKDKDPEVRAAAARLAGVWQVTSVRDRLVTLVKEQESPVLVRRAALEGLAALGDKESLRALQDLHAALKGSSLETAFLAALAPLDTATAARLTIDRLEQNKDQVDLTEPIQALLQRKDGATALSKALGDRELAAESARAALRAVRLSGREVPDLVAALTKAGKLSAASRVLAPERLRELVSLVEKQGDAARGERLYRSKEMNCLKCHAIAGAGGLLGPDLSSIGASAQIDYLIESLLQPGKAIKENYHSLVVATRDGRLVTGIKVQQNDKNLVLRDAEDREIAIPRATIEEIANGGSLMPEGLVDTLTQAELCDLVRFLSELGKVGPYAVGREPVVRRWQVLQTTRQAEGLLRRGGLPAAATNDANLTWSTAYSVVGGTLPLGDLPILELAKPFGQKQAVSVCRAEIEVATPGRVVLRPGSTQGLSLWVDGVGVPIRPETTLDLTSGRHTLTLAIQRDQVQNGVRLALGDVPDSPARARFVGGK